MTTVDEYVRVAQEAQQDGAHVAVLMNYRTAIDTLGYNPQTAPILLEAVRYAQGLKKERDRLAVAQWGLSVQGKMAMESDLVTTIRQEIAKLQAGGRNGTQ